MGSSEEFDWVEFNNLADSFLNEDNEAKQRTGISRYYYGTFCIARDFLKENGIFLNNHSKKILNSKNPEVHREISNIFKKHNQFQKNKYGRIISNDLNKLRKMRNEADYDGKTSHSLEYMMKKSKNKSERILGILEKLN